MSQTIIISNELKSKAEAEGILTEDIQKVIENCTSSGEITLIKSKNICVCHLQISNIVLWVSFRNIEDEFQVVDFNYNRSSIIDSKDTNEKDLASKNTIFAEYEDDLVCMKCSQIMALKKIIFKYLNHNYQSLGYSCEKCGQIFEPTEIISRQREKIEQVLEGK